MERGLEEKDHKGEGPYFSGTCSERPMLRIGSCAGGFWVSELAREEEQESVMEGVGFKQAQLSRVQRALGPEKTSASRHSYRRISHGSMLCRHTCPSW